MFMPIRRVAAAAATCACGLATAQSPARPPDTPADGSITARHAQPAEPRSARLTLKVQL
jgi:hypothetical protein